MDYVEVPTYARRGDFKDRSPVGFLGSLPKDRHLASSAELQALPGHSARWVAERWAFAF